MSGKRRRNSLIWFCSHRTALRWAAVTEPASVPSVELRLMSSVDRRRRPRAAVGGRSAAEWVTPLLLRGEGPVKALAQLACQQYDSQLHVNGVSCFAAPQCIWIHHAAHTRFVALSRCIVAASFNVWLAVTPANIERARQAARDHTDHGATAAGVGGKL